MSIENVDYDDNFLSILDQVNFELFDEQIIDSDLSKFYLFNIRYKLS